MRWHSGLFRSCSTRFGHRYFWAPSSARLDPYHGLPVVRRSGGDNKPLAIGHLGWACVHALSGLGKCCGSLKPFHGAPEPGSETVRYGEFVSFGTANENHYLYDSFAGHNSVSPDLKHATPGSWIFWS